VRSCMLQLFQAQHAIMGVCDGPMHTYLSNVADTSCQHGMQGAHWVHTTLPLLSEL
jgi:hypothetical protein